MRRLATDADFRVAYTTDPVLAITTAGIPVTSDDLTRLEKLGAPQLEQIAIGMAALAGAATASAGLESEGTHTLLYAIIAAALIA